ncbi:hypothetical protein F3Y22_tig00111741pilonHSYRG00151 [Hibiscus syriacus]|uniref:Uncharacterized protein n=2 Tax=Hibiscus syriacus TaxID=106335 RepID=A0A6A2YGP2_HIBSY|nr:hypothetical protein F3Y22_tig00111741pilonHSYRG00151 [Hibiscus syriacus]
MACGTPIPTVLIIHGIWPQDANDVPIPPYNASTNPCYSKAPITDSVVLQNTAFTPIESNLISLWPDLKNPTQPGTGFWEREWLKNGTCSDYPNNPLDYFKSALTLRQGLTNPGEYVSFVLAFIYSVIEFMYKMVERLE